MLSGTQHFLLTRRRFPGAWQLLTTWGRLEIPARAPPISLDIILAIAGFALSLSRIDYDAILLTGFHCILRTMEALTISPGFIALGSDCRGALALPWTKVGQQRGAHEVVTIDEPLVGFWLRQACEGVLNDAQLMTGGPHQFRTFFQQAVTTSGLQELGFKPYSLRRGGATHDFLFHHNVQRTLMRGRWGDVCTGRIHY